MSNEIQKNRIEQLLNFGFPWREDLAQRYLERTLLSVSDSNDGRIVQRETGELLESILSRQIRDSGATNVVIPLSGGFDSRTLLAAALRVIQPERIRCFTFGTEDFRELKVARKLCSRLGVDWEAIDPNRDVEWSLHNLVDIAGSTYARTGSYVAASWAAVTTSIEQNLKQNEVILSGYLGDSVAGAKIESEAATTETLEEAVYAFLRKNCKTGSRKTCYIPFNNVERLKEFVERNWGGNFQVL